MNSLLRNVLAFIVGLFLCLSINMLLIGLLGSLVPPPEGVDSNDFESIKSNLHLYSVKQMLMPFFAHAIGTFIGAFVASKIASSYKLALSILIGIVHLAGGIYMVILLENSPLWFNTLDLIFAYLPMAWIGYKLAK